MDEMENQVLPPEPEYTEETAAETAEVTAEPEQTAAAEPEQRAAAEPAAEQLPPAPQPVQPPRRRSPYENSPYVMAHQPRPQTANAAPAQPESVPEKPKKRKKHPVLRTIGLLLLVAAVVLGTAVFVSDRLEDRYSLRLQSLEDQIDVLRDQLEEQKHVDTGSSLAPVTGALTPGQVYARNEQSVVLIETDVASGSGFVLTADGYVVTNYHVVEGGSIIDVVLYDRTYHQATLVGYEANNDVALLKIEGQDFQPVTLGSSDALRVGDQVAAIGNPLGELTSTLTVGYVSAMGRDISTDSAVINMIQTDCAINSGNSGGPLFNMKGEVVGITTAKYSGMSASGASIEGIGFAVPMDDVAGILDDLMEFGYVKSGYLGVSVYSMDPGEAAMFNLPMGSLVDSVTPGSCADKAGVKPSDIIIGLGGYEIEGNTDLTRALRAFDGGETTTITVYRSGRTLVLPITLDEKPRQNVSPQPGTNTMPENGSYEEWYNYFFGE